MLSKKNLLTVLILSFSLHAYAEVDAEEQKAIDLVKNNKPLNNTQILNIACWKNNELLQHVFKTQEVKRFIINKCLVNAASIGKLDNVKLALNNGADINYRDSSWNGNTALIQATRYNNTPDVINFLLNLNPDLTVKNYDKLTISDLLTKNINGFNIDADKKLSLSKIFKPYLAKLNPSAELDVTAKYNDARRAFKTNIVTSPVISDGKPLPAPKNSLWQKITFKAPLGDNLAYIAMPKNSKDKLPVLIWSRGGHGGLGGPNNSWPWGEDSFIGAALKAVSANKLILMIPSWRGDNLNNGHPELFLGEIDDALAAIDYVTKLPNADVNHIYMAGHSTGATVTTLTAIAANGKLRSAFGFSGFMNDYYKTFDYGYSYAAPFEQGNPFEAYIRSPSNYIGELKTPMFHFAGKKEDIICFLSEDTALQAQIKKIPFYSNCITEGNHTNYVRSLMELVVQKILDDTNNNKQITFTQIESQQVFEKAVEKGLAKYAGD